MIDIWAALIPFLMVDLVSPTLFTFLVYAASTKHPVANSGAVLLGHTLAYFSVGLIVGLGFDRVLALIADRIANPYFIDYIIGLLIGMLLLWVAFRAPQKAEQRQVDKGDTLTPVTALGLGAIINFFGIPFALPYFAAVDQILKANLSAMDSVMVLVVYNILYALPFMTIPILAAAMGKRSQSLLQKINEFVGRISRYLLPVLLALAGIALISDAIRFFVTGKGLW